MHISEGYSPKELQEFREIILNKLAVAKKEVATYRDNLRMRSDSQGKIKIQSLEESPEVEERESLNYQIRRQEKFIQKLEEALKRIEKGTYGICAKTGELIPKDRLKLVPHTTHSIIAKQNRV
ncbi:MAG: TraR/DksA C4-type zinc finger protein [Bacteroidota bacterium]